MEYYKYIAVYSNDTFASVHTTEEINIFGLFTFIFYRELDKDATKINIL